LDGLSSTREILQFKFGDRFDIIETDYAVLQGQMEELSGQIFLHIHWKDLSKWSKSIYWDMLDVLNETEQFLKSEYGIQSVFISIDAADEKLIKFETMFGFEPFREVIIPTESKRHLIMVKEF
jgi:hypothetical protein